jgi:L-cysteine desulfidase
MLEEQLRQQIIALVKREVIPAVGCTEPIAVALAVASSQSLLNGYPSRIHVALSPNMLKNAMGVGIPGTGMTGLPIAIALGAICGDSKANLEVLAKVTPDDVAKGKSLVDNNAISISLAPEGCDILYIEATVTDDSGHTATTVISGSHTNIVRQELDGKVLTLNDGGNGGAEVKSSASAPKLTMAQVWEFAMESPLDELKFILESRRINKLAAERSFTGRYGHEVGRTLHCERQRAMMGDSIFSRVLSYTSAACDARMAGAPIPVMSNSGSGNQGIAATLPVAIYAEEQFASEEQTVRALMLSHLTVIYIKQSLGRLSALCGCVVAATGSACGICYLMGGNFEKVVATAKNMIANLTGMICDGAKPSCAMKLASGVSTAMMSAMMAMEGQSVCQLEGIVDDDIDRCVSNLTRIGREGMRETDRLILEIMTSK